MNLIKPVFSLILALFVFSNSHAQFEIGILAGTSSTDLISNSIDVNTGTSNIMIGFEEAAYGFHAGLYTRVSFLGIYVQPAIIFNTSKTNYRITDLEGIEGDQILSEIYDNIDIPLQIGIKAGILRLYTGPVAHLHIDSRSDLLSLSGYSQNFKEASYGLLGGIGLDILKLRIDLSYETNFSKFGDHITIDGQQFAFDKGASRLIASVGWKF